MHVHLIQLLDKWMIKSLSSYIFHMQHSYTVSYSGRVYVSKVLTLFVMSNLESLNTCMHAVNGESSKGSPTPKKGVRISKSLDFI